MKHVVYGGVGQGRSISARNMFAQLLPLLGNRMNINPTGGGGEITCLFVEN